MGEPPAHEKKKPYSRPTLMPWGAVSDLTRAGNGRGSVDGLFTAKSGSLHRHGGR